jgi:hypothetical protein
MTVQKIIEGLMIIQKSKPETESDYHFRAEHDEIWAGNLEWQLSERDEKRLVELGWTKDSHCDGWHAHV